MLQAISFRLARASRGLSRLGLGAAALVFLSAPSFPLVGDLDRASQGVDLAGISTLQLDSMTVQGDALLSQDEVSAQERNLSIPFAANLAEHMAPFRSIPRQSASYSTALDCMTEAIYYEAANESLAGKRGVAQVILNRVAHPAYPSSVCGVVYQGWSEPVCQFSYTCDGALARRPVASLWQQSRAVAQAALGGYVEDSVGSATHYHADYVLPYWAYRLDKVHVEGRHIFYRLPGAAGHADQFTSRWSGGEYKPAFDPARFMHAGEDETELGAGTMAGATTPRDVTDRRAENDVGGRLDTSTNWRLAIPDPVSASSGYRAALEDQQHASSAMQTGGSNPE